MANKSKSKGQPAKKAPLSPEKFIIKCARNLPIDRCLLLEEEHLKIAIIVRKEQRNDLYTIGCYLVDTWCRGVYDTFAESHLTKEEIDEFIDNYSTMEVVDKDYAYVHNLVLGAVEFAEEAGIKPHKDFAVSQYVLAEDTDDIPLIEFEFGLDGKHALACSNEKEFNYNASILEKNLAPDQYTLIGFDSDTIEFIIEDSSLTGMLGSLADSDIARQSPMLQKAIRYACFDEDAFFDLDADKRAIMMGIADTLIFGEDSITPDAFMQEFHQLFSSLFITPKEGEHDEEAMVEVENLFIDAYYNLFDEAEICDRTEDEKIACAKFHVVFSQYVRYIAAYTAVTESCTQESGKWDLDRIMMQAVQIIVDIANASEEIVKRPTN